MYTGTLIDDLMAAVELAQQTAQGSAQKEELNFHFAPALYEVSQHDAELRGAA
jgi:hypothetical protein